MRASQSVVQDFLPFKSGYKWVYQVYPSIMKADTEPSFFVDSIYVTDSFSWEGKTGYKVIAFDDKKYWIFLDNELREYSTFPTDTSNYTILLKTPLKTGNRWFNIEKGGFKVISQVEETNLQLSLPAGDFNSSIKISNITGEYWYTPHVGLVKYHVGMWTAELIRYKF